MASIALILGVSLGAAMLTGLLTWVAVFVCWHYRCGFFRPHDPARDSSNRNGPEYRGIPLQARTRQLTETEKKKRDKMLRRYARRKAREARQRAQQANGDTNGDSGRRTQSGADANNSRDMPEIPVSSTTSSSFNTNMSSTAFYGRAAYVSRRSSRTGECGDSGVRGRSHAFSVGRRSTGSRATIPTAMSLFRLITGRRESGCRDRHASPCSSASTRCEDYNNDAINQSVASSVPRPPEEVLAEAGYRFLCQPSDDFSVAFHSKPTEIFVDDGLRIRSEEDGIHTLLDSRDKSPQAVSPIVHSGSRSSEAVVELTPVRGNPFIMIDGPSVQTDPAAVRSPAQHGAKPKRTPQIGNSRITEKSVQRNVTMSGMFHTPVTPQTKRHREPFSS